MAVFLGLLLLSGAVSAGTRPNILFLMADQMRADLVGASGNDVARTPNIDRLAHEGVVRGLFGHVEFARLS